MEDEQQSHQSYNSLQQRTRSIHIPIITKTKQSYQQHNQNQQPITRKQCRICLQSQQSGRIVQPCQCSGTVIYAHQHCMIQWITRKHDPRYRYKVNCQLCHTQFDYKIGKNHHLSCVMIKHNFNKQKFHYIAFCVMMVFLLIGIIGITVIITSMYNDNELGEYIRHYIIKSQNVKIVYICVIFLLVIILMFMVILFITEYGIKSQIYIHNLKSYQRQIIKVNKNNERKVYPRLLILKSKIVQAAQAINRDIQ